MAGLRAREPDAFHAAYEAHADRLYSFALRLAGRADQADEIYQETWLKLAQHAPGLRSDTRLCSWLFTVAHNHWRSVGRRAATASRHEDALAEEAPRPARPDEGAERRARLARLEQALATLPADHREVLAVVVEGDGLSQKELAAILGLRHAAFRKRLSRARRALEEAMDALEAPRTQRARKPSDPVRSTATEPLAAQPQRRKP